MRARNREINIFNMSLLDILCGALGAFCFMMLTLFPHYGQKSGPPPPPPPPPASGDASAYRDYSNKLKKQVNELNKQVDQLNRELNAAENKLKVRETVGIQIWWFGGDHDIDLYVRERFPSSKNQKAPAPDPAKKQNVSWTGDSRSDFVNS